MANKPVDSFLHFVLSGVALIMMKALSFQTSPFCQNLEIRYAGSVFTNILAHRAGVILKKT